MKVDFMIIGAQKCGTTTLFNILNRHPSIEGCGQKEPHFFSETDNWKKDLNKYHSLFSKSENVIRFEASTTYTFYPLRSLHIWTDIYEYNPNMKFIYLVRKPKDRMVSSYMHTYERGYTNLSIEEALVKDRLYLDITRYYTQVRPYIQKFGRENVKIIDFDDLVHRQKYVVDQISEFLEVDVSKFPTFEKEKSNVSVGGNKNYYKYDSPSAPLRAIRRLAPPLWEMIIDNSSRAFSKKPALSIEMQEMIVNMLFLEIQELARLMNKDLSKWMVIDR